MLAALYYQEMYRQVEVNWRMLHTIVHSLIVHDRVLEVYINFALIYMSDNILPVLPIKDLIKMTAIQPRRLNLQQVQNIQ